MAESDPPYSAWGLWGKDDELGRTNLITPDITRKAAQTEIRTGQVVQLKYEIISRSRRMKKANVTSAYL